MNKLLKVNCPNCKKEFSYYESEFRPFCCERCKMVDLGHWFEETYKVPTKETVITEKNTNPSQPGSEVDKEESGEKDDSSQKEEDEQYDSYTQIDEDQYDENDY